MTLPRLLLLVLLVLACTLLGLGVVATSERSRPTVPVPVSRPVTDGPVAVLRDWDRRRAEAWADRDVAGLRRLYAPRSTAGLRDAARLSRWVERGLRVRRLETQVLRARVLVAQPRLLVLSVTDRIARAVATGGVRLPDDGPSTWRITLRRVGDQWKVAAVRR